jgi:DNA/RNA-binding domain of Phe-tRNA-synthetase-like protein
MNEVTNPASHPGLTSEKEALEEQLRLTFGGLARADLEALPILRVYKDYYRRFNKTYHVQLQLESILYKNKSIPSVSALVEAMFMAEMKNMLLTAGHDLDTLQLPLILDVSTGEESYVLMRGDEQTVKPGDMLIADRAGVVSNIIYGPDQRTQIRPSTRRAIFTVYAPPGITEAAVGGHLQDIEKYILLFAPQSRVELMRVFGT